MSSKALEQKVGEISKALTEASDTPEEMLQILLSVTASALVVFTSKMTPQQSKEYVVGYLMQVTKLIDGTMAAAEPAKPSKER